MGGFAVPQSQADFNALQEQHLKLLTRLAKVLKKRPDDRVGSEDEVTSVTIQSGWTRDKEKKTGN